MQPVPQLRAVAGVEDGCDFAALAADRNLKNKVFDAVDIHGDWLRLQTSIYEITKKIDARLGAQ